MWLPPGHHYACRCPRTWQFSVISRNCAGCKRMVQLVTEFWLFKVSKMFKWINIFQNGRRDVIEYRDTSSYLCQIRPDIYPILRVPRYSGSELIYVWAVLGTTWLGYTPGQKFIEFFFNELSHRDNGEYQQFVNSGMVTYRFSKKLRNIECVGALATVQCP